MHIYTHTLQWQFEDICGPKVVFIPSVSLVSDMKAIRAWKADKEAKAREAAMEALRAWQAKKKAMLAMKAMKKPKENNSHIVKTPKKKPAAAATKTTKPKKKPAAAATETKGSPTSHTSNELPFDQLNVAPEAGIYPSDPPVVANMRMLQ
jgi:hypothetical protein